MSRATVLYGTEEAPPPPRRLQAGPLSVELEAGNLRYVRFGGVEIIRAIAFLVRGPRWATYDAAIDELTVTELVDRFRVTYRASVRDGAVRLHYAARIEGYASGTLDFQCDIQAATDFETCRTGFIVLHPASVAGQAVRIEHADGRIVAGLFPRLIDPVQPLRDLRALTHEPAPALRVACRMEGDVFEMEDQRNWTDASFKTYVRPLSRPWPYRIEAGGTSTQSVSLHVTQAGGARADTGADTPIRIDLGDAIGVMPPIGLGCTPGEARAAMPHAPRLAHAGVARLVCRFDPGQGHLAADLRAFRDLSAACESAVELQIVVHSVDEFARELRAAADAVHAAGLIPEAVAVSPAADLKSVTPGQPWPQAAPLDALYRAAREVFPGVPLGGGTFAYFTELNRKRPPAETLDFVTFSTAAIVHTADDRSVMESLQAIPPIVLSLAAFTGGKPFVVGPSAIGMRDNPYGPAPLVNPAGVRLAMAGADPRQRGVFNAAWTMGYIAAFAVGGAARIAVSAPVGDHGILDEAADYPVFGVIRGLAALRGAALHRASCSHAEDVTALLARQDGRLELWLANLTATPRSVTLPEVCAGAVLHRVAGASAARPARAGNTIVLDAYEVVRGSVSRQ